MRNKIRFLILIVVFLGFGHTGCAKKPSADDKILAKVSNRFLTLKEFNSKIAKMPPYYHEIVEKNKRLYLEDMITEMLFYEEAIRTGVNRDREVEEVVNDAKKKIIIAKFIKNEVDNNVKVTEDETRQFYEANKDEFKTPELWRASHILVASEGEAKDILNELGKGASFEELAKSKSIDATATRGGDVGYFRVGQVVPDFEKACLKLKVGETSDIVHTQFGYHIIKLTDKKEPGVESLEKIKNKIESELKRKKRTELFDKLVLKLKDKYGAVIKEDAFESIDVAEKEKAEAK